MDRANHCDHGTTETWRMKLSALLSCTRHFLVYIAKWVATLSSEGHVEVMRRIYQSENRLSVAILTLFKPKQLFQGSNFLSCPGTRGTNSSPCWSLIRAARDFSFHIGVAWPLATLWVSQKLLMQRYFFITHKGGKSWRRIDKGKQGLMTTKNEKCVLPFSVERKTFAALTSEITLMNELGENSSEDWVGQDKDFQLSYKQQQLFMYDLQATLSHVDGGEKKNYAKF